jgi:two-component system, OmpR family, response regulator
MSIQDSGFRLRPVSPQPARILIVDDDAAWRDGFAGYLREHGFEVFLAGDVRQAERLLQSRAIDVVLLEALLPGEGGFGLCQRLAARREPPVVLISDRAEDVDRIIGLEVGAEDFTAKACSRRELLARIRAVLRRRHPAPTAEAAAASAAIEPEVVRFAGWALRPSRREVESPAGQRSVLTPGDFKLLSALLDHPGEVLSREQLASLSGVLRPVANLRSIDTSVRRLRMKLGCTPEGAPVIRTLYGVGYMLDCRVEKGADRQPVAA